MSETEPLDRLMTLPGDRTEIVMRVAVALADAAAAMARLDQALANHPLRLALLYRTRLDAVQRQAAADGALIDPWHLAAVIEGLRLRMDPYLRIIDRGQIADAARTALGLHQWLVEPDFDQEGEVQRAEAVLAAQARTLPPLLAGAQGVRVWIEAGEGRAPMRAALIRFWTRHNRLRLPLPLTGAAAFAPDVPWEPEAWVSAFLRALEREAADWLDLLFMMERKWFEARHMMTGRRRTSHAAAAVDVLAAAPVLSATSLARILGIAVKNAIRLLDELCAAGIAIEVTHRSKRRLFGLAGLTPLREVVRPPYRPDPTCGRGRPRHEIAEGETEATLPPLPPLSPIEKRVFDYNALEEAMACLDDVVRRTRQSLALLPSSTHEAASASPGTRRAKIET